MTKLDDSSVKKIKNYLKIEKMFEKQLKKWREREKKTDAPDLAELKAGMYENTSLVLLILNVVGGGLACLIPYDVYLSIASKI